MAVKEDVPGRRYFQHIDAPEQSRFARSGRSDHADDLSEIRLEIDIFKNLDLAEILNKMAYAYYRRYCIFRHLIALLCSRNLPLISCMVTPVGRLPGIAFEPGPARL